MGRLQEFESESGARQICEIEKMKGIAGEPDYLRLGSRDTHTRTIVGVETNTPRGPSNGTAIFP